MKKNKEKDTTVWKPKGNQKITRPSGPRPRSRKVFRKEPYEAMPEHKVQRSQGYDAPSSTLGKLGLLMGVGAVLAYLTSGIKNSEYFKEENQEQNKDQE